MRKNNTRVTALAFMIPILFLRPACAPAQAGKAHYPDMAPLDQYLISDEKAEIAFARSAAPASISDAAEVMVLRRDGYATAVKGSNGFVCLVERSWANTTDNEEFWNSKIRAPHCFNAAAARTVMPIFLMKTNLVLAGKSKAQILATVTSALETKELPALAPGAMAYMMAKHQYLNDEGKSWHPHVMFFAPGDAGKSWGANLPGCPIIAANDPEQRITTLWFWPARGLMGRRPHPRCTDLESIRFADAGDISPAKSAWQLEYERSPCSQHRPARRVSRARCRSGAQHRLSPSGP